MRPKEAYRRAKLRLHDILLGVRIATVLFAVGIALVKAFRKAYTKRIGASNE